MPVTGELIRMMNFADDLTATFRRIHANVSFMNDEERKRLADYLRGTQKNLNELLAELEAKGNG